MTTPLHKIDGIIKSGLFSFAVFLQKVTYRVFKNFLPQSAQRKNKK